MKLYVLYVLLFPNGKRYFGISHRPAARFEEHLKAAEQGRTPVYAALRKYRSGVAQIILCKGSREFIADLEQRAIAAWRTTDRRFGYNLALGGSTSPMASPEVARQVGATLRTKFADDPVFRAKALSALDTGRKRARVSGLWKPPRLGMRNRPETNAKISAGNLGRINSPESYAKASATRKANGKDFWGDPGERLWHGALTKLCMRPPEEQVLITFVVLARFAQVYQSV